MSGELSLDMSSRERTKAGCIVTLREQKTGRREVRHLPGKTGDTLPLLAAELDARNAEGEEWRVASISTPASVYRDLQGARGLAGVDCYSQDGDPLVERGYLGRIGRLDLIESRSGGVDASSRLLPLSRRQQPSKGLGDGE